MSLLNKPYTRNHSHIPIQESLTKPSATEEIAPETFWSLRPGRVQQKWPPSPVRGCLESEPETASANERGSSAGCWLLEACSEPEKLRRHPGPKALALALRACGLPHRCEGCRVESLWGRSWRGASFRLHLHKISNCKLCNLFASCLLQWSCLALLVLMPSLGSLKRRVRDRAADPMWKICTSLWRNAGLQVKIVKTFQRRSAFGRYDFRNLHLAVAKRIFASQNRQSTSCSDHFWRIRCRKFAPRCGETRVCKSKSSEIEGFATFLVATG